MWVIGGEDSKRRSGASEVLMSFLVRRSKLSAIGCPTRHVGLGLAGLVLAACGCSAVSDLVAPTDPGEFARSSEVLCEQLATLGYSEQWGFEEHQKAAAAVAASYDRWRQLGRPSSLAADAAEALEGFRASWSQASQPFDQAFLCRRMVWRIRQQSD
jgi:hypothetical protein